MTVGILLKLRGRIGITSGRHILGAVLCASSLLCAIPAISVQAQQADDRDQDLEELVDYIELWDRGEYQQALDQLEENIATQNRPLDSWTYDHSRLLFTLGRVDEAIEILEDLIKRTSMPSHGLDIALMHRYKGHEQSFDYWLKRAAGMIQNRRWLYRRRAERDQNVAAIGHIYAYLGNNPKTILSAHYKQYLDMYDDLTPVVHTAAGDMAYRTSNYNVAAGYYEEALAKDPKYQDALAGLMDCFWKSHDNRLQETMNSLLTLNPNHPRAHAVLIEQNLELGDTESAYMLIEKMLAINPVSQRFQSLLGAAYFIDDRQSDFDALTDQVLNYNPVLSEFYRTAGRFASRHYRFKEGAAFQQKALELNSKDHEARALYSLDLLRLGNEEVARVELEIAFAADPFNVTSYNMLELLDTLDTFAVIEHGDFVLKLPVNEEPVIAVAALDLLDHAMEKYRKKYRVELETPILIEMFDNHDDFMVRSVGLPGNVGHLGICFGKLITMDTPSVRPKGSTNWRSVLWHEFVHVITLQRTNNRMPRWLSEGISVHEERNYSEAFYNRLDADYRKIVQQDGYPAVADLNLLFIQAKSGQHLMFGYFAAGEFINGYVEYYGFDALVDSLEAIAEGTDALEALLSAAQVDADELDTVFKAHLEDRMKPMENLAGKQVVPEGGLLDSITNLFRPNDEEVDEVLTETIEADSDYAAAMQLIQVAMSEENWDAAIKAMEKAHDLFPDYAGADSPLRQRAALYKKLGRDEEYENTLREIVAWTPRELDAALTLLKRYEAAGDMERAMEMADWALGIDPYDPAIYRVYVKALLESDDFSRAMEPLNVLIALDEANEVDYRLQRARLYARQEEYPVARMEVIQLLEDMPHYWGAQELLLEIADASITEKEVESTSAEEPLGE